MPRTGPRRVYFGARLLTPNEHTQLQQLADRETGGNLSALVRRIVLGELSRQQESATMAT